MKAMTGQGGDAKKDQIPRRVLACFWDRGRAHWGDEVEFGILATGFKDGAKVEFAIYEVEDEQHAKALKTVQGKIDKGRAKGKYKVDFEDADVAPHDAYLLYFIATVDGAITHEKKLCPLLHCDADAPTFSD
jgi:hypothetical protein